MEKSNQISHQGAMNPSAPPEHLNKSSIHQHHQGIQHQPGIINSGFQSDDMQPPVFVPPNNTSTIVVPTYHERPETYCRKLYTNRRQTGSISGGLLLMLVSGLHIGWGMWWTGYWPLRTSRSLLIFAIMAWPLGAIFGGLIGSALLPILRKNIIYYITAVVMIIGNVLFIIWDESYAAIVIGRLLTSLAHGLVFITLISHAGENASKNMRGTILSTINCMLYTAIFIAVHVTGNVQLNDKGRAQNVSSERILGIIALIFVLASIICTITVTVETVPYLLRKNKPNMAMVNMKHLRDVASETPQITKEMGELSLMIIQDKENNANIFNNGNGKPLILIIIVRLMVSLTNNLLLNTVLIGTCQLIIYHYRLAPLLLVGPRLAVSIVQIFYADFFGRKTQIIVSSTLAGLTMIGLGIFINTTNIFISYYVPSIFAIWFQLFCSMGIDQMADVYLSEAFSTAKKPWSISFVMGIEHVFHVFMIGMAFTNITINHISALVFITGIFITAFGITLLFTLPETRGTTLKQARDLFRDERIFVPLNISSPYS